MAEWTDKEIIDTSFITHSGPNGYQIHFETNRREAYEAVQNKIRDVMGHGKPQTNADRIRAYTDMELAMFMTAVAKKSAEKLCESLKTVDVDLSNCDFGILTKAHLDWLKQEVDNG